jgi:DNA-binding transcriptional ArsR family regulator
MDRGFDWRSLGKADYAQAAAIVASLPEESRREIKGVSDEILHRLVHLMWYRAEHSGRGAAYCTPSLATLGRYCLRSVRTVQRHLEALSRAGLIEAKERFTRGGTNTSSLYTAGKRLLAMLCARYRRKSAMSRDTTKMSHDNLKKGYNADVGHPSKPYTSPPWMQSSAESPTLPKRQSAPGAQPVEKDEGEGKSRRESFTSLLHTWKQRGE